MDDRVAFLCADPGIPPDGHKGASVHLRAMATALHRVGVALDVVVARAGSLAGFRPHRAQFVAPERARGLAGELRQIAHAEAMLAALQDCGPHRAVYERLSLFGLAGLLHARALGVPFVVEANAPLWREAARFRHLGLQHAARGVCRDVMQGADKVLAVSHALADELVREGVRADRVEVLGNGADLARFADAPKLTRPASLQGRPTMVFLGSLKPWHGIGFLLDAFAALRRRWPTCGLWIVGDGPERERVRRAVADADGAIVHTESVPHERVPSVLQAADVAVAPYTADAPSY
ncbi:MAG TPA: glycosyltransferase, partial [bacterium]|nr:glycosyltransferase [bacterium]